MKVEEVEIQIISGIQAINIPANFKIEDNKVYLKKMGNAIYIIPYHNPWQNVHDSLELLQQILWRIEIKISNKNVNP